MTSGKNLHKSAAPVAVEAVKPSRSAVVRSETKMLSDAPARAVDAQQIAELAYSYWLERGEHHGYAEEDWLRAERELATAR